MLFCFTTPTGFPLDLTILMAREKELPVNTSEFEEELQAQKDRARKATQAKEGDLGRTQAFYSACFLGYETTRAYARITRYRKVKAKNKEYFQNNYSTKPLFMQKAADKQEIPAIWKIHRAKGPDRGHHKRKQSDPSSHQKCPRIRKRNFGTLWMKNEGRQ